MNASAEIAAGLVIVDDAPVVAEVADTLRNQLNSTTVWQSAYLPVEMRGQVAYGEVLARWSSGDRVSDQQAKQLDAAWSAALPPLEPGTIRYLRLRVESGEDVKRLREISEVDGLTIAPSLESRGARRSLQWRWPFRVGVVDGPSAKEWLATLLDDRYFEHLYDAELFDAAATYDIAIVHTTDLSSLTDDLALRLGEAACVIVVGDGPVETLLQDLETRIEPAIAIAVNRPPGEWWRALFSEMSHDVPIDAAVETVVKWTDVDAMIAGPRYGMDVTAAGRWFVAVAPEIPELATVLENLGNWYWTYESEGATDVTNAVRAIRNQGIDPVAIVRPPVAAEIALDLPMDVRVEKPAEPRRLIARVFDGNTVVPSILPPKSPLTLAIRIAVPESGDTVAADEAFPALPGDGPTVNLDVVVSGGVWAQQPQSQTITISRDKLSQPSTWAVFPFTTPDEGAVVNIEVRILYRGKPLQAATYTSPVRRAALPDERPTLTTFALSGPDEPTDELRPVDLTLDGTGAELKRLDGDSKVLITDVREMLDRIEERVSRVLGVTGAPDSLDDPRALELLIKLAGIGTELGTFLEPLGIDNARSINVIVNPDTRVLPLELVYAGPPPDDNAQLCKHVGTPPPPGEPCTRASTKRVCPYAFWGLHRSIARTVRWRTNVVPAQPWTATISASSVLYGATVIADDGASEPLPSSSVLTTAQNLFARVNRVTSWTSWRKAVKSDKPNLLVVLGHTEGTGTTLYIGKKSVLARLRITTSYLRTEGSPRPLVLLIACATAALGDSFGSLPGTLTAKGAGAVVGTLSKIVGPHGALAASHLLQAIHDLADTDASVGDAVAEARRSLIRDRRPIGLVLVSHGEMDTKVVA